MQTSQLFIFLKKETHILMWKPPDDSRLTTRFKITAWARQSRGGWSQPGGGQQAQPEPPGPLEPRVRQGGSLGTRERVPSLEIRDSSSSPRLCGLRYICTLPSLGFLTWEMGMMAPPAQPVGLPMGLPPRGPHPRSPPHSRSQSRHKSHVFSQSMNTD